jgi:hypothetical protein
MNLDRLLPSDHVRINLSRLIPKAAELLRELCEANIRLLGKIKPAPVVVKGHSYHVVDIDTSPMDNSKSHKEGVSYTYKGFDGFQPILAYIGKQGYMIASELRVGSQHCQKGTPEFIVGIIKTLKKRWPGKRFLFRLDSGNDAKETLDAILTDKESGKNTGHYVLIKRNKRQEDDEK